MAPLNSLAKHCFAKPLLYWRKVIEISNNGRRWFALPTICGTLNTLLANSWLHLRLAMVVGPKLGHLRCIKQIGYAPDRILHFYYLKWTYYSFPVSAQLHFIQYPFYILGSTHFSYPRKSSYNFDYDFMFVGLSKLSRTLRATYLCRCH